jgi:hypothetical protein
MNTILAGLLCLASACAIGPDLQAPKALNYSPAPAQLAQVMGGSCQTPFGICPLLDPNGVAIQAPLGSPCFCGPDSGTAIQQ